MLLELATKCEQATGPDQSLNAGIVLALGGERKGHFWWIGERLLGTSPPAYTASLDAAMTLVPVNCDWLLNARYNFAQVWETKETGRDGNWECQRAATPALALCAAALRARAALHDREDI